MAANWKQNLFAFKKNLFSFWFFCRVFSNITKIAKQLRNPCRFRWFVYIRGFLQFVKTFSLLYIYFICISTFFLCFPFFLTYALAYCLTLFLALLCTFILYIFLCVFFALSKQIAPMMVKISILPCTRVQM